MCTCSWCHATSAMGLKLTSGEILQYQIPPELPNNHTITAHDFTEILCDYVASPCSTFPSKSSISSGWQFTGVSKARLPSTSWTAATQHRTLPVVSDFDLLAATISSYHDIVAARSAVGRSPSPVRWPGMRCLMTSETRRSVPTISGRR